MTRSDLLAQLSELMHVQFELVLERAKVPPALIPGREAAQGLRAIDVIRYLEPQGRLEELAQILAEVTAGR